MPLGKYLLHCHATVSVRLLVGCRRLEQIVPHMNVQQGHPFRSHLNPNQSCFRKYLCENQSRIRNHWIGVLCHCDWHYFFRCLVFQYARNQVHVLPAQLYFEIVNLYKSSSLTQIKSLISIPQGTGVVSDASLKSEKAVSRPSCRFVYLLSSQDVSDSKSSSSSSEVQRSKVKTDARREVKM